MLTSCMSKVSQGHSALLVGIYTFITPEKRDVAFVACTNATSCHHAHRCYAVNRPREQAKDSEVFCTLAASGVEQAKKLAAGAKVSYFANQRKLFVRCVIA